MVRGWLIFLAVVVYIVVLSYVAAAFPDSDAPRVFSGGGILLVTALFVINSPKQSRLVILAAGVLLGLGVELALFEKTAVLGVVVLALLVALTFPVTLLAATRSGTSARKVAGSELTIWLAVGALVALGIVGGVALTQRLSAAYVVKHGAAVVVALPASCTETLVKNSGSTSCKGATWKVDGATVTGTLYADYGELSELGSNGKYVLTDKPVDAFADGDTAVTTAYAGHSWFLSLAKLPWFVVLALPIGLILLPFAIRMSRRARAAAGLPPRAKVIQFKV